MRRGKRGERTDFERMLDLAHRRPDRFPQPDCAGRPAEFVDYEYPLPSAEDAAASCERCPLLELCAAHARKRRPSWGIYGGQVWIEGRQAHNPQGRAA